MVDDAHRFPSCVHANGERGEHRTNVVIHPANGRWAAFVGCHLGGVFRRKTVDAMLSPTHREGRRVAGFVSRRASAWGTGRYEGQHGKECQFRRPSHSQSKVGYVHGSNDDWSDLDEAAAPSQDLARTR